jgi:hypothetical protein
MNTLSFRTLAVVTFLLIVVDFGAANISVVQTPGTRLPGTPSFTFDFDEQGNSLLNGGPNPNPAIFLGGGPGITGGIQFVLPGPVTPGSVLVTGSSDVSNIFYTDLAINPVDATEVTSAAHPFGPQDVGGTMIITSGTGFIVQSVTIASVTGNVATLSAPAGTVGSTGGVSDLTTIGISDLLVFGTNTANQNVLTYLSLIDDTDPKQDAADVLSFNTNNIQNRVAEIGPEGSNDFNWTASGGLFANYHGVSDGFLAPEPSTLALGIAGFASLGFAAWRKKLRRA